MFKGIVCGLAAFQLLALSQADAQSIGVNFEGRNGAAMEDTDVAGVVPQTNWTNLPPGDNFDGTQANLIDSAGEATTVEFEWETNDGWNSGGGTATPDERLMKGIQKANPDPDDDEASSFIYFRFRNLVAGSTYNVVVYQMHNSSVAKARTTVGGTSYFVEQPTAFSGTFVRGTSTDTNSFPSANYVQFDNVSPDGTGMIEIEVKKIIEGVTDGIGVPGIQLVKLTGEWPQPADPPMITADVADELGVVGDDMAFTIGIDGPWDVEWFKNAVSQGTSKSTTLDLLATTAADKDAQVYAIVSNPAGVVTSRVATLVLDDPQPEQLVQGFLKGEHYADVAGTAVYPDLHNHPAFQARTPDSEFYTLGGNVLDTGWENFGRLMEGWVTPPVTGNYTFHIRSDDASEIFIDPVGGPITALPAARTDFSGLPDATEVDCCDPFEEPGADTVTLPFAMTFGEYYAMTCLYKEGGGGDWFQVTWREAGDTTPAASLSPLGPEEVWCMASPAGKRAAVTNQPQSVTVLQNAPATFEVGVETMPRDNEFAVQWTKNGVNIPGANGGTYTTDPVTLADEGAVYQAKIFTLIGQLLSDAAVLTVNPDSTAPTAVSSGVYTADPQVGILFDEALDGVTVSNMANYTVDGTTVTGVELVGGEDSVVVLTLAGVATPGGNLVITNITDLAGNPTSATLTLEESTFTPETLINTAANPTNLGTSAYLGGESYYMAAGGSDLWGPRDAGYMVTTLWTGAFDMRVRMQSLYGPNTWTKGGIMAREVADGGSRNLMMLTTPTAGQNLYQYQWRDTADTDAASIAGGDRLVGVIYPDAWIRLVRPDAASNLFETYLSMDGGTTWTPYFDHTVPGDILPETLMLGMTSTSHDNGATAATSQAVFRDFSITTPVVGDLPEIDGVSSDGTNISIMWSNGGELETAPSVEGPWTPTGDTSGAYSEPLGPDVQKYYRPLQQ